MKYQQAITVAIAALEREARRLAVDANLLDQMGLDTPTTRGASEQRAKVRAAIAVLRGGKPAQQVDMFEEVR